MYNANNEGDYTEGIEPLIYLNELNQIQVFALGDERELLVHKAIELIIGNSDRNQSISQQTKPLNKSLVAKDGFITVPQSLFDVKN